MGQKYKALCKNYRLKKSDDRLQHVLIPCSKFLGLIKGEICVLCNKFFFIEFKQGFKKNDNRI